VEVLKAKLLADAAHVHGRRAALALRDQGAAGVPGLELRPCSHVRDIRHSRVGLTTSDRLKELIPVPFSYLPNRSESGQA
jgi:hypothetical protein